LQLVKSKCARTHHFLALRKIGAFRPQTLVVRYPGNELSGGRKQKSLYSATIAKTDNGNMRRQQQRKRAGCASSEQPDSTEGLNHFDVLDDPQVMFHVHVLWSSRKWRSVTPKLNYVHHTQLIDHHDFKKGKKKAREHLMTQPRLELGTFSVF
jgi:hypothetical protein